MELIQMLISCIRLLSLTSPLDIEEVDIMGGCMNDSVEEHLVGNLTVKPDILIGGKEPSKFWTDNSDDITEHWKQD